MARLYIEPTLKEESRPTGDPVVSDPLHPSGMYRELLSLLCAIAADRKVVVKSYWSGRLG